jgi:hypothetical protein
MQPARWGKTKCEFTEMIALCAFQCFLPGYKADLNGVKDPAGFILIRKLSDQGNSNCVGLFFRAEIDVKVPTFVNGVFRGTRVQGGTNSQQRPLVVLRQNPAP